MKVFLTPESEAVELAPDLAERAARLGAAHATGARFLAVTVHDNRDAASWALASFHSPIIFVPLPANLPAPARASRLAQLPGDEVITPEELPAAQRKHPILSAKDKIWAVIFSSGTSGEPKGVALTGSAFEASARAHAQHSGAGTACWLLDLPICHVGGLSVLTRALFLDANIALSAPQFSAPATASWVRSGRVQGLSLVPTTLIRLLREQDLPFEKLQLILLGGAPATAALAREARGRGAPIRHTYGMTEHSSQIATEITEGLEPLPGVEVKIVMGEILVRSPMLARGYFSRGKLEPLPLEGGFFPTGDLGGLHGGRLRILGRKSELLITGGQKVHPAEVESALAALPGITDCAVTGEPSAEWGEAVVAFVVGEVHEKIARETLKQSLEAYKVPKRFVSVIAIPRNSGGKIVRAELKKLL
jgi:O-succinylbenzoic acid--CoA ligase